MGSADEDTLEVIYTAHPQVVRVGVNITFTCLYQIPDNVTQFTVMHSLYNNKHLEYYKYYYPDTLNNLKHRLVQSVEPHDEGYRRGQIVTLKSKAERTGWYRCTLEIPRNGTYINAHGAVYITVLGK